MAGVGMLGMQVCRGVGGEQTPFQGLHLEVVFQGFVLLLFGRA